MLAVKSMDMRGDFKSYCEKAYDGEILIISRPHNENVVMMSLTEFNELMKAKRNADYINMLTKSMDEAANGGFIIKSIEDLEKE